MDRAKELRKNDTDAEARFWHFLRNRRFRGFKFRRQHPIGLYFVDFVCLEKKLVIELDGGQHAEQCAYDERRTNFLESRGYRVIRCWNNHALKDTQVFLEMVRRILEDPSPQPSPRSTSSRGEGA